MTYFDIWADGRLVCTIRADDAHDAITVALREFPRALLFVCASREVDDAVDTLTDQAHSRANGLRH